MISEKLGSATVFCCDLFDLPFRSLKPIQVGYHYILLFFNGKTVKAFNRFYLHFTTPLEYLANVETNILFSQGYHRALDLGNGAPINFQSSSFLRFYKVDVIDQQVCIRLPDDYAHEYFCNI